MTDHVSHYPSTLPPDREAFLVPDSTPVDADCGNNSSHRGCIPEGDHKLRCMDCLIVVPTWTQMAKHMEKTEHTLPRCAQCLRSLKCYGPLRPNRHEHETQHRGFVGIYYGRSDYYFSSTADAAGDPLSSIYMASNWFTGLSVRQYQCVCGISFLHAVQLAHHLVQFHGVSCIEDCATCHTCKLESTLEELCNHLHAASCASCGEELRTALARKSPTILDEDSEAIDLEHQVLVKGFDALEFLRFRPPHLTTSGNNEHGGSKYTIYYQCRDCLRLFQSWTAVLAHVEETNHSSSYCVRCRNFVPALDSSPGQRGVAPLSSLQEESVINPSNLSGHMHHVFKHYNFLGFPASPDELEVLLVDQNQEKDFDVEHPAYSTPNATDDTTVFVYQCAGTHSESCCEVFLYYGDFVNHIMHTGHCSIVTPEDGGSLELVCCRPPSSKEPDQTEDVSTYLPPMVAFRRKFRTGTLCVHFGYERCSFCGYPFPSNRRELHEALCVARERSLVWQCTPPSRKDVPQ